MSASRIWNATEGDFPANGSPRQKLEFAIKYAALAPTENDLRPWHFRVSDAELELMARPAPASEAIDPDGRESIIGCGAALLYVKLALKHFGCLGRVALFPDLDQPALAARVHFGFCREREAQEKLLFEAMSESRANVSPLGEIPVSETMLAALGQAAAGERGWLDFVQSEMSRQLVMEIRLAADRLRINFDHSRRARGFFSFGGRTPDSKTAALEPVRQLPVPAATLAVVKTKTDDKHGWLAAGETMARTVLQAQALGLSWGFYNPMRRREAREALRMGVGHKGFAQIILRFGSLMAGELGRQAAPTTTLATFR
jgi:hypothetical protein